MLNGVCEVAVPSPVDVPPIRSPQAVHSIIAARVAAKDLVEIGTRNGDGMACFAQHARRATAIEYDRNYCDVLRNRSQHSGRSYKIVCADYRSAGVLDADVVTWWEQPPLLNRQALEHLLQEQNAGRVRASAVALVLFDAQWEHDTDSWRQLCPLATWSYRVHFDERARCLQANGGTEVVRAGHWSETCTRAKGKFIVAEIPVRRVRGKVRGRVHGSLCIERHASQHDLGKAFTLEGEDEIDAALRPKSAAELAAIAEHEHQTIQLRAVVSGRLPAVPPSPGPSAVQRCCTARGPPSIAAAADSQGKWLGPSFSCVECSPCPANATASLTSGASQGYLPTLFAYLENGTMASPYLRHAGAIISHPALDDAFDGWKLRMRIGERVRAHGGRVGALLLAEPPAASLPTAHAVPSAAWRLFHYAEDVKLTVARVLAKELAAYQMLAWHEPTAHTVPALSPNCMRALSSLWRVHSMRCRHEEQQAGGRKYEWVLKLREDAHWFAPLDMSLFTSQRALHVKGCARYGGVNDHAHLFPREHAQRMLSSYRDLHTPFMSDSRCWLGSGGGADSLAPHVDAAEDAETAGKLTSSPAWQATRLAGSNGEPMDSLASCTSEQWFARVAKLWGIPIVEHPPEEMPTADARLVHSKVPRGNWDKETRDDSLAEFAGAETDEAPHVFACFPYQYALPDFEEGERCVPIASVPMVIRRTCTAAASWSPWDDMHRCVDRFCTPMHKKVVQRLQNSAKWVGKGVTALYDRTITEAGRLIKSTGRAVHRYHQNKDGTTNWARVAKTGLATAASVVVAADMIVPAGNRSSVLLKMGGNVMKVMKWIGSRGASPAGQSRAEPISAARQKTA